MTPPAGAAGKPSGQAGKAAAAAKTGAAGQRKAVKAAKEPTLTWEQAIGLQRALKAGFSEEEFQKKLKELDSKFEVRSRQFMRERSRLFMTVQGVVLPKYGFAGNYAGLVQMMTAFTPFFADPEFVHETNAICTLLGLPEHRLPDPPEPSRSTESDVVGAKAALAAVRGEVTPADAEERGSAAAALLKRTLYLYYMNVSPTKFSSSEKRQTIQENVNPLMAASQHYVLVPRRVPAVTPDSDTWKDAKRKYGRLVMDSGGKDSWSDAAANCILLSFLDALRFAEDENSGEGGPAYVVIAEDDMVLDVGFRTVLEASVGELELDPRAMGAMLHSNSMAENMLQSFIRGPALRHVWPRYPMKPVLKRRHSTTWPGQPVIPDQPLVALLKTARLRDFREMYENRLLYSGWSPLDWLLANTPFGETGILRLVSRNGFCKGGDQLGTGSVRTEQHKALSGQCTLGEPTFSPPGRG